MQNAISKDSKNSTTFRLSVTSRNQNLTNQKLLPIFHFAEINGSNPNRRFDIYSADELLFSDFSPSRFQVDSVYQNGRFLHNPKAIFTLNKTRNSTLPPLINAHEVYILLRMENLTTDSDDGKINVYTARALHICHVYDRFTSSSCNLFSWLNSTH